MTIALDGNNPGGMNDGAWAKAQPGYIGPNGRYAAFDTLTNGGNAMTALLASYIRRGYNTARKIATRWAPVGDGNDTAAYAGHIADGLKIGRDITIPVERAHDLMLVMARIENGLFPSRWATEQKRVAALATKVRA